MNSLEHFACRCLTTPYHLCPRSYLLMCVHSFCITWLPVLVWVCCWDLGSVPFIYLILPKSHCQEWHFLKIQFPHISYVYASMSCRPRVSHCPQKWKGHQIPMDQELQAVLSTWYGYEKYTWVPWTSNKWSQALSNIAISFEVTWCQTPHLDI